MAVYRGAQLSGDAIEQQMNIIFNGGVIEDSLKPKPYASQTGAVLLKAQSLCEL